MKAESKYPYRSGWCGSGNCERCTGEYGGTVCTCPCGHEKPVQAQLDFVPEVMPPRARVLDPAPLLAPVWLGTESLAVAP